LIAWLLLSGFEVRWERDEVRKSRVAVLVDRSASMGITDRTGDRDSTTTQLLQDPVWDIISEQNSLSHFAFSDKLANLDIKQPGHPDGAVTDINRALSELSREPGGLPDAIVLISDGAVNRGVSPLNMARSLDLPIFPVVVGDSLLQKDVVVTSIENPRLSYIGEEITIDARVRGTGVNANSVEIRVVDEQGKILARDTLRFRGDWSEVNTTLKITPGKAGLVQIFVEIDPVEGEVNQNNNRRKSVIQVAERRRKILLLSGGPLPDAGSIARVLEEDEDSEPLIITGGGPKGKLLRGKQIDKAAFKEIDGAIICLGAKFDRKLLNILTMAVEAKTPMVVITGAKPDKRALEILSANIGKQRQALAANEVLLATKGSHPIFTLDGYWFADDTRPPPPVNLPAMETTSGKVLASATIAVNERAVVVETRGNPRTLVFFLEGIWRWDLGRREKDPGGVEYRDFWNRVLRWMLTGENEDRITVQPSRELFTGGEEIELVAFVKDEALRPLNNATVTVEISHQIESRTLSLANVGDGKYSAQAGAWGEGLYDVFAIIEENGNKHERHTQFAVDAFRIEDAELRMRPERLREMAQISGGKLLLPDQLAQLPDLLPDKSRIEKIKGVWLPFGLWKTLLIITLLLGIEWFIRIRRGML
jgi:hypothetical protein